MGVAEHRIRANGIDFNVAMSDGSGPQVMFLHGFPESWIAWRPVIERLPDVRSYAPDLRGYGKSARPAGGYDVWTLLDDVRALIEELELDRPVLAGNDWGGALVWMFGHRYPELISRGVVVNCTHPKTLVHAVLNFEDFQTIRIPWVPLFQPPKFAEWFLTTRAGRKLLRLSFTMREGRDGTMDTALVDEIVAGFQKPSDMYAPVEYYREMVRAHLRDAGLARLRQLYSRPIGVPMTLVWGTKDEALSSKVAQKSHLAAKRDVDWRPLEGVGHYVGLEAPELLTAEIERVIEPQRAVAA